MTGAKRYLPTVSNKTFMSRGFKIMSLAPKIWMASKMLSSADKIITGMCLVSGFAFRVRHICSPLKLPKLISNKIKSGLNSLISASKSCGVTDVFTS